MKTLQKIQEIEQVAGGPVAAARLAGVSYQTWWRWSHRSGQMSGSAKAVIDLLYVQHVQKVGAPQTGTY